jgi:hypothetical protein
VARVVVLLEHTDSINIQVSYTDEACITADRACKNSNMWPTGLGPVTSESMGRIYVRRLYIYQHRQSVVAHLHVLQADFGHVQKKADFGGWTQVGGQKKTGRIDKSPHMASQIGASIRFSMNLMINLGPSCMHLHTYLSATRRHGRSIRRHVSAVGGSNRYPHAYVPLSLIPYYPPLSFHVAKS